MLVVVTVIVVMSYYLCLSVVVCFSHTVVFTPPCYCKVQYLLNSVIFLHCVECAVKIEWVTLSFHNAKVLHQTTSLTPN